MVVRIKKSARHKRRFPKKHTKKYNLRGGALTAEQIKLLRMLSKVITWGSLGFISYCVAMPLIEVISGLLALAGLDTMTTAFYNLIWVNLSSTMSSLYIAASTAGAAVMQGLNVLAKAGNLCAAVHATVRLANPIYSFALSGIQHFIEIMKNPLNFNTTIQRFLGEQKGIIEKFLGDYKALGTNASRGIAATNAYKDEIYEQLRRLMGRLGSELEQAMPKRSAAEIAARDANLKWLANCEDFVFNILSTGMESANSVTAFSARHKYKVYQCALGAMGAAKEWISYFNECAKSAGSTIQYIKTLKRRRTPSPQRSPPPSPKEMVDLATLMMTQTLPEEEASQASQASQYEDAVEPPPGVAAMLRRISPEPEGIKEMVREFDACPRGASAPPDFGEGERRIAVPRSRFSRRLSLGNGAPRNPSAIRKSHSHMRTITESPEPSGYDEEDMERERKKKKTEGGRKTHKRVHFKKRRRTRKL